MDTQDVIETALKECEGIILKVPSRIVRARGLDSLEHLHVSVKDLVDHYESFLGGFTRPWYSYQEGSLRVTYDDVNDDSEISINHGYSNISVNFHEKFMIVIEITEVIRGDYVKTVLTVSFDKDMSYDVHVQYEGC